MDKRIPLEKFLETELDTWKDKLPEYIFSRKKILDYSPEGTIWLLDSLKDACFELSNGKIDESATMDNFDWDDPRFQTIYLENSKYQMGVSSLNITKAVFLDRDGVINRALIRDGRPYPPNSLDELEILPGVLKSLSILKNNGFLLVVVTNQPDVGRGKQEKKTVEKIHAFLLNQLPLMALANCYPQDFAQMEEYINERSK